MNPFKSRIIIGDIKLEGAEARRVVREALSASTSGQSGFKRARPLVVLVVVSMVVSGIAAGLLGTWLRRITGSSGGWWHALVGLVTGFLVAAVWARWVIRRHRRELCRAMARYGYEICQECGYWLKGLSEESMRCPECGAERDPMSPEAAASKPSPPRGEDLGEGRNDN
ncbi:MAG: hypothetical protein JSV91_06670 [Phycisphaerales bacterium]|nr:MAG: hypothetical protein JSV91_06670 [Phycisphaerales bacterium]